MTDRFKLWIGRPFPPPNNPKSTFVLRVGFIHGRTTDSISTFEFPESSLRDPEGYFTLQNCLFFLSELSKLPFDDQVLLSESFNNYATWVKKIFGCSPKTAQKILSELVKYDRLDPTYTAMAYVNSYSVTWYDRNGVQYYVDIVDTEEIEQKDVHSGRL